MSRKIDRDEENGKVVPAKGRIRGSAGLSPPVYPSSDEVEVEVKDDLSCSPLCIEDKLVPRTVDARTGGYLFCPDDHLAQDGAVLFVNVVDATDVLLRNDEDVDRGSGPDIMKRHKEVVLKDHVGRSFVPRDLTEYTRFFSHG